MKVVLKPLANVELPQDFAEILKAKLRGREVKTGEVVTIDILGKPLEFKVVQATPSPIRVSDKTSVIIARPGVEVLEIELIGEPKEVFVYGDNIVVVLENEVLILNQNLEEIYRERFENLIKVIQTKAGLVVVDGRRLKLIKV
ncbi:ATPase [Pyrococcus kukulkanii]|uniref:ATPase n=1 Tax=Pyrococcus kukulkanii TaxID=1609559 RepID=A0A127BBI0_9EURY|nr:ATPase [Pyrococcus kukulkanii]AMM54682.1 ATPase [Pyrococcus kukulkanii]